MAQKLDRLDLAILRELQADAKMGNQALADKIGLSPSQCLRRVQALESSKVIKGYGAKLDAQALGLSLTALVHISMDRHTPERFAKFEAQVATIAEVVECLLITGQSADYQLRVAVSDMQAYQELLLGRLTGIEGVSGVHSSFVLRQFSSGLPIPKA